MNAYDISRFLSLLTAAPSLNGVFNPWRDVDEENDRGPRSPEVRRAQLGHYLESRLDTAKFLIIGEAVGYQGGHFTGIPMTSERILLGFQINKGIHPSHVLPRLKPRRTSKPEKMTRGFAEPTATIVWNTILNSPYDPSHFVLWNAFAWHPFDPRKGILSNRKPQPREMANCSNILEQFVYLFSEATVIAMGKVAEGCLKRLKINCQPVRHPAQGGAKIFRNQLAELFGEG